MIENTTTRLQNVLRIILGLFMLLAAVGHFTYQRTEFQAEVPNWIPISKDSVVLISGLLEIFFGFSMIFWSRQKIKVGILLALFYLLIFPGNIAQYLNNTDAFGLNTDRARLIRLFFQPLLILWAVWCTGALTHLRKRLGT
jgi:uncharacterized membrane protein